MSPRTPRGRRETRWRRLAAALLSGVVVGGATVLVTGTPAAAHGQFVSSDPAPGSTVTEPLEILYLWFTQKPTSNAYFAVTAPSGVRVDRLWSHGPTRPLEPRVHEWYHQEDGEWVVRAYSTAYSAQVPIAYWPEAGEYKVEFLSVASDGQPVRGELTFIYAGPTAEMPPDFEPQASEPDPNLLAVAGRDAPTAPPTGPPIEEIIAAEEAGPGLWIVWVPLGLSLAVLIAIVIFWRLRPEQARELVVSRFGGRYAAPVPRRPLALPARLQEKLPAQLRGRRPQPAIAGAAKTAISATAAVPSQSRTSAEEAPVPAATRVSEAAAASQAAADSPAADSPVADSPVADSPVADSPVADSPVEPASPAGSAAELDPPAAVAAETTEPESEPVEASPEQTESTTEPPTATEPSDATEPPTVVEPADATEPSDATEPPTVVEPSAADEAAPPEEKSEGS